MENMIRIAVSIDSFSYPDGTTAMGSMKLEITQGEFAGVLGSNGSGKTTLLKIMDGLLKDYQGTVFLDGTDIRKLSPREIYSKVGLIFQNPDEQLFAGTVFDDVAFGPLNMGFKGEAVRKRVRDALKNVEMEGFEKKPIHNLSYGQKKRVCIAGLLAMGHELLLLDEPTAGLDPMGEYRMMSLLQALNRQKCVTIVMATHSVDLVPLFLDRLYILSKGEIVRGGTPEEVFSAPDEMSEVKLRLPQIAELIYRLKHEDKLPFDKIPLTIGEARRVMMKFSGMATLTVPEKKTRHRQKKGYTHVYTGTGKGKTTAALGLALRAAGAGLRVFVGQFVKKEICSEHTIIEERFPDLITVKCYGEGLILKGGAGDDDKKAAGKGLADLKKIIASGDFDMVILDEANVAAHLELIEVNDLLEIMKTRPQGMELVITGRYGDERVMAAADLVTEMRSIKHYKDRGVKARRGIER